VVKHLKGHIAPFVYPPPGVPYGEQLCRSDHNAHIGKEKTMNELIKVHSDENDEPMISGRELHEFSEVETPYNKWFSRMAEYGFDEGKDFNVDKNVRVQTEGNREVSREITDHQLTIPMAKEISMLQRTEKGTAQLLEKDIPF
jgi:phage anti-repressor protein